MSVAAEVITTNAFLQSGSSPPVAGMDSESLGIFVRDGILGVATKLVELKPYVDELYKRLDRGEVILGCKTKKDFCQSVLRRTPRAVRYMLAGGNYARGGETVSPQTELNQESMHLSQPPASALTQEISEPKPPSELAHLVLSGCENWLEHLRDLQSRFDRLGAGETILGCNDWYNFIRERLGKNPAQIRSMLRLPKGPTPPANSYHEVLGALLCMLPTGNDSEADHIFIQHLNRILSEPVPPTGPWGTPEFETREALKMCPNAMRELAAQLLDAADKIENKLRQTGADGPSQETQAAPSQVEAQSLQPQPTKQEILTMLSNVGES